MTSDRGKRLEKFMDLESAAVKCAVLGVWLNAPAYAKEASKERKVLGICIHHDMFLKGPQSYTDALRNPCAPGGMRMDIVISRQGDAIRLPETLCEIEDSATFIEQALIHILVNGHYAGIASRGTSDAPSRAQIMALTQLVPWLQRCYHIPDAGIFGHHHLGNLHCPGAWGIEWINAMREEVEIPNEGRLVGLLRNLSGITFDINTDMSFSWAAYYALSQFQEYLKIPQTGIMDSFTWYILTRLHEQRMAE